MTCSPAPIANRRVVSSLPTGPKAEEDKGRSRRNALKVGAAGDGLALPDEDPAEVARRFAAIAAELGAKTELGAALAHRAAILTVRLERGYRHEAARLALAVDGAARAFDDARLARVEKLLDTIADDPATNARRLQATPEGVGLTIEAWKALRLDLAEAGGECWGFEHRRRAENLMGRQVDDLPVSRVGALCRALRHDPSALEPGEAAGLDDAARPEYARSRLLEWIDARIVALGGFLATFDGSAADRARLGAADRALFDASPESVLARKYDAATERSLFRTLRELREVEVEARAAIPADPASGPDPEPETVRPTRALGSFGAATPAEPSAAVPTPRAGLVGPGTPARRPGSHARVAADRPDQGLRGSVPRRDRPATGSPAPPRRSGRDHRPRTWTWIIVSAVAMALARACRSIVKGTEAVLRRTSPR